MEKFVKGLKEKGRHLVTIIDPHISTNEEYEIARTLSENSNNLF
jgi:alpha-glucosidase (family GH31 glycosyl hydrolase)